MGISSSELWKLFREARGPRGTQSKKRKWSAFNEAAIDGANERYIRLGLDQQNRTIEHQVCQRLNADVDAGLLDLAKCQQLCFTTHLVTGLTTEFDKPADEAGD